MRNINILIIIVLSIFLIAFSVKAESKTSGITVTPAIIHIDLADDPPEYTIEYHNLTKNSVTLILRAQDFSGLEDGWKVNFLDEKSAQNYRYSLSSWIDFDKKTLSLAPGEKNSVSVTIDERGLAPGGHYASILAEIMQTGESGNVELKGALSSLVFVRVRVGQEMEKGEIRNFKILQDFWGLPYIAHVRFNNKGNVDLVPHGSIKVYNPFSELIIKDTFNAESLTTLPESIRRYDHVLNFKSWQMPGFYRIEADLKYGKSNKKTGAQDTFFSFGTPINIIAMIPVIVLLVVFMLNARIKKVSYIKNAVRNRFGFLKKYLWKR